MAVSFILWYPCLSTYEILNCVFLSFTVEEMIRIEIYKGTSPMI